MKSHPSGVVARVQRLVVAGNQFFNGEFVFDQAATGAVAVFMGDSSFGMKAGLISRDSKERLPEGVCLLTDTGRDFYAAGVEIDREGCTEKSVAVNYNLLTKP